MTKNVTLSFVALLENVQREFFWIAAATMQMTQKMSHRQRVLSEGHRPLGITQSTLLQAPECCDRRYLAYMLTGPGAKTCSASQAALQ